MPAGANVSWGKEWKMPFSSKTELCGAPLEPGWFPGGAAEPLLNTVARSLVALPANEKSAVVVHPFYPSPQFSHDVPQDVPVSSPFYCAVPPPGM